MLWLSPGGLGIRIPERGLGPLCSLGTSWFVVVVPMGPGNYNLSSCGCPQGVSECTIVIVSIIGLKP